MRRTLRCVCFFLLLSGVASAQAPYTVGDFLRDLDAGRVQSVKLDALGNASVQIRGADREENIAVQATPALLQRMRAAGADVVVRRTGSSLSWLTSLLPIVLLGLILFVFWRSMRGGSGGGANNNFGRSRAHVFTEGQVKVTFSDVAGCDEAKADLVEVVEFLKSPERFHSLGARIPHGILLVGPPGSGKTLLAKAVAGEARVPYFSISGSDFVEMFVGVGAARVRDLFDQAKKAAPCIVFIDEIDAVGRKRGMNFNGGNDEREQTLNQLLVEMDGFESKHDIIILAATNRPDVLDAALLRPGRFDRQVVVDAPDVRGREMILKIHARKKPLDPAVDLGVLAQRTPGMVGADLENLLNEAALLTARDGRSRITMNDLDEAADRVLMGPARKSRLVPEHDKKVTAYHEVGHALVAQLLPHADRVHKLTVVPRGRAAGYMLPLPTDRIHYSREVLEDTIAVALAGQAAEEVTFGEITTGAQNDFQKATNIARKMVTEWGMSQKLGKVAYSNENETFLGGFTERSPYSQIIAQTIDDEVKLIIDAQYRRVKHLLSEHLSVVHRIVGELLVRETLTGDEFQKLLAGGQLEPLPPATPKLA